MVTGKYKFSYFNLLMLYAICMPVFYSIFGSVGAMLVNGGLILLVLFYYLLNKQYMRSFNETNIKQYLILGAPFIIFLFLIPLSMLNGVVFGHVDIATRDFFEYHRPILGILIFTFTFSVFFKKNSIQNFHRMLIIGFVLIAVIGLIQLFRLNDRFIELYTKYRNITSLRVAAPFANPYDFAFVMSFFVVYFFIAALYYSRKYIVLFIAAFIMFLLPQSRSVLMGLLFCLFVVTPFILTFREIRLDKITITKTYLFYILIFIAILLAIVIALSFIIENLKYLTTQFILMAESGDVGHSGEERLRQLLFAVDKANNPFIFMLGNGPSKLEMEYVESMYTYQFYRYGFIGLIVNTVYPVSMAIILSWRILGAVKSSSLEYVLFLTIVLWFLALPVYYVGNNFTEQIRTSFIYYSLLAAIAARYSLLKDNKSV